MNIFVDEIIRTIKNLYNFMNTERRSDNNY